MLRFLFALSLCFVAPALAHASEASLGSALPLWSVLPFAVMLLAIAILPLAAPKFWHHNKNRALVSAVLGTPIAIWIGVLDFGELALTFHHYIAFIILLASLYIISGGVVIRGTLAGSPGINTLILLVGTLLASVVGTTGASMLLIRPLLRANEARQKKVHVVVFFIFLVSNVGGLLTPLGDPPLFLGFLAGVPFFWTLRLIPQWAMASAILLVLFYIVDSTIFRREDVATPGDLDEAVLAKRVPLRVDGKLNILFLFGVVAVILASGAFQPPPGVQEAGMALFAALSLWLTPKALRQDNQFSWGPIVEVAVIFAGIFATMIPALAILNARGAELGLHAPWHYFWATGALSSFLDNAPTYLTFASAASGLLGTNANHLNELITLANGSPNTAGVALLAAISVGAVCMGANTYIGNGPNFMVKAIAEESGLKMPSFFGYMAWSGAILIPIFILMTFVFFV
jgi:Na+/H+ antiporter NhaD/arsenite permease-like protein